MINVEIKKLTVSAILPKLGSAGAAAMDIHADIHKPIVIKPGNTELITTGISIAIPSDYEMVVRPRSGLAIRYGVTVLNSPGTIDSDYRGEIKVILINHGHNDIMISNGDRIAQIGLRKVEKFQWEEVESLSVTERGSDGFGSTGKGMLSDKSGFLDTATGEFETLDEMKESGHYSYSCNVKLRKSDLDILSCKEDDEPVLILKASDDSYLNKLHMLRNVFGTKDSKNVDTSFWDFMDGKILEFHSYKRKQVLRYSENKSTDQTFNPIKE